MNCCFSSDQLTSSVSLRVWMNGSQDRWMSIGRERGSSLNQLEGGMIPWKSDVENIKKSEYRRHGMGNERLWRQASPILKFGLDQVQFVWFNRQCKCLFFADAYSWHKCQKIWLKKNGKGQTSLETLPWNNDLLASSH